MKVNHFSGFTAEDIRDSDDNEANKQEEVKN